MFRALSCLALAAWLAGCGGEVGGGPLGLDEGLPAPRDYAIHGIDVSKYQGDIDWDAVAASGVKFVWIKATEGGDHADEKFQANWDGAKRVGIAHGAYHFVYWCRPPNEEVGWFEQNTPLDPDALPQIAVLGYNGAAGLLPVRKAFHCSGAPENALRSTLPSMPGMWPSA